MPGFICEERLTYGPWQAFERAIARLILHAGFKDVMLVGGAGDHGADVVGVKGGQKWVLQAKYRANNVGVDSSGAKEALHAANKYDATISVLIANTYLTQDAYKFHEHATNDLGLDLRLWNGGYLLKFFDKLKDESKARRELRPYQETAVNSVEEQRGKGKRQALVVMATGLGKSLVASELILNELNRNPDQEVLVLAHMTDLVRQLEIASWPQLLKQHSTHLWLDGELPAYRGGVVFATWQSLYQALNQQEESLRDRFSMIVVDEAHHAPSESFSRLLKHLNPNFLVGLTATPWRGDERSLSDLFGEAVFKMDIIQGMQAGFLASVDYRMLTDGIDWDELILKSKQGLSISDLNRLLLVPERDLGMVEMICEEMGKIAQPRGLAFCRSIDHAERLMPYFSARGINVAVMHSDLSREQRFNNLAAFRRGEIDLLISVEMLNEGIDVPDVNLIAFMRVTHSRRIFLQQLGRGLRISANKDQVVVLDFVADIRRVAAGLSLNRSASERRAGPEIVRYRDGQIVKFDNGSPAKFFDQYIKDIASIEDADDSARLRFPDGEDF